ncbi:DUF1616 domain-containing protein, partial [Chloroflexota bacterium]
VRVIVSIINREDERVSYRLEVKIDGERNTGISPLLLDNNEIWKDVVIFTPYKVGNNQKVEFLLYKNEESEVYLKLHLWVNVKG